MESRNLSGFVLGTSKTANLEIGVPRKPAYGTGTSFPSCDSNSMRSSQS